MLKDKTNVFVGVCFQDLLPDMEKSWPDLLKPASVGFWYCNSQSFHFLFVNLSVTRGMWRHAFTT